MEVVVDRDLPRTDEAVALVGRLQELARWLEVEQLAPIDKLHLGGNIEYGGVLEITFVELPAKECLRLIGAKWRELGGGPAMRMSLRGLPADDWLASADHGRTWGRLSRGVAGAIGQRYTHGGR